MEIEDLPKNKQLLIYMLDHDCCANAFTLAEDGRDAIAWGITKNMRSLSSMLSDLACKGFVEGDGHGAWWLTDDGEGEAIYWKDKCDEVEDVFAQPQIDSLSISDALEDIAIKLAVCKVDIDKGGSTFSAASTAVQAAINCVRAANEFIQSQEQ